MRRLVGISGKAGVGKNTAAAIAGELGYVTVAIADPMKRFLRDELGFSETVLWGPSERRDEPHPVWDFSARDALRLIGEAGRLLRKTLWIDVALATAREVLHGRGYSGPRGLEPRQASTRRTFGELIQDVGRMLGGGGVVIPDVRFRNEFDAIRRRGGALIRIRRCSAGLSGAAGCHASETELDSLPDLMFDAVLYNNTSVDKFAAAVQRALGVYRD